MKRPAVFLAPWLDAFRRSRIDNHGMVSRFVARLERQGQPQADGKTGAALSHDNKPYAMGGGWNASAGVPATAWGMLRAAVAECNYLHRARRLLTESPQWVIADDRRTGLIESQQRLRMLWAPFGVDRLPAALEHASMAGRSLLLFTPNLQALRAPEHTPGLAHLCYMSMFVMPALHPWRFLRNWAGGMLRMPLTKWHDRQAWITTLLAACITVLFKRHAPDGLALITSNSFVVELIRYMFVASAQRGAVVEVLHGVPTREIEAYHATMHAALHGCALDKLQFVAPVPGLNLKNYPPGSVQPGVAINLKFNDTADRRNLQQLARDSALRLQAKPAQWRVSLMGAGNITGEVFTGTSTFALERAILAHVQRKAGTLGLPIHLQYAVHPAHLKSGLVGSIAGQLAGVEILEDSFVSWLESDLSIAILSSGCWEAKALGCQVVIGISPDDGIYSAELLDSLAYPHAGESIFDVIDRELEHLPSRVRLPPAARLSRLPNHPAPA